MTCLKVGIVSAVVLTGAVSAFGGIVDLAGGSTAWLSVRGTDNSTDIQFPTIALPAGGTLSLTKPGVTASADYAWSSTAFTLSNVQYSEAAAGGVSSFADLYGQIGFMPNVDVTYTISGSLNWTGQWANGLTLWARLQDITVSNPGTDVTNLFFTKSGVLTNASLSIVPLAGNPVTGTLTAGRTYEFDFELAADNNRFSPQTGSANGGVAITFVPDPATMLLLLVAAPGLRRRR
jgi:hypothetical protein